MAKVVEMKKMTRGRQKIQMRLIEDKEDRVITFSKRKGGIFKKASEISVMCGAKVLFILFSPVGKAYSFAHPTVKSVADKFLGRQESGGKQIRQILDTHINNRLENQVLHHNLVKGELEAVSEQVSALSGANKFQNKGWWEANINEMNSEQDVEQVLKAVLDLEAALSNHFENLKLQNGQQGSNSNPVVATYDQLGVMNNFPPQMSSNVQMTNWNGGNLSSVGEFGNPFPGLNAPSAVSFGGGTVCQGDAFSMLAAGYGGSLGQGSGFSLPAAGTFGLANDYSGWSGVGYEGATGLSGGAYGSNFYGRDPGGSLYGSGYGGTFMYGLPDPTIGFQGSHS